MENLVVPVPKLFGNEIVRCRNGPHGCKLLNFCGSTLKKEAGSELRSIWYFWGVGSESSLFFLKTWGRDVKAVKFLWKWKHFEEKSWKRKQNSEATNFIRSWKWKQKILYCFHIPGCKLLGCSLIKPNSKNGTGSKQKLVPKGFEILKWLSLIQITGIRLQSQVWNSEFTPTSMKNVKLL